MRSYVALYDVRVVDGFLFRLDVVRYLNSVFFGLRCTCDLIVQDGDFLDVDIVNYLRYMYFRRCMDLKVNLYFLHEVSVLSDKNYKRMCEKLNLMEKEIGSYDFER